MSNNLHLIGCASGIAGADVLCGEGPLVLQQSSLLKNAELPIVWEAMISPPAEVDKKITAIEFICKTLAEEVASLLKSNKQVCVLGGDHSCAIGTWSGVHAAIKEQGDFGLIWIDAHMDSHTPKTSESGRIHGMPLAVLLGQGFKNLTTILSASPKLKAENLCLIGVRSFESGEAAFLKALNVRIYFMEEVKERGFLTVLKEAIRYVKRNTVGFGLSLDLDSIDPEEAPAVDVPEPDGIKAEEIATGLELIRKDSKFLASEIVEFDPKRDKDKKTEKLIIQFLDILSH